MIRTARPFLLGLLLAGATLTLSDARSALAAEIAGVPMTLNYYRALAESGSADAQLTLGDLYRHGDGVPADLVEAYAWYYLAAQQGLEEAINPMNEVLRALPEAMWERARERAEAYAGRFVPAGR